MTNSLNKVEISRKALRHNFSICRERAHQAPILALVKAEAYGHGMVECARVFASCGAVALGVAEAVEGVTLRRNGIKLPIFVLAGVVPQTADAIVENELTPVVTDDCTLQELGRSAVQRNVEIKVHLKMDVGMGRQGVLPPDVAACIDKIRLTPGIRLSGVMAHFSHADVRDSSYSATQLQTFSQVVVGLKKFLPTECCLHVANSGGIFYVGDSQLDMVRPGISLYGYYPDGLVANPPEGVATLKPAMRFVSRIIQVRKVPAGVGLGYGHIFTTSRPSTVAVLPVGYEDGYLRCLSNKAEVLIKGCRASVIGRISMNLTLVDVTDLEAVKPGDEAVLLGQQGQDEITADELAHWMDTISYEVLCLFGKMNDRVYVD